jgi:hypothetical protein
MDVWGDHAVQCRVGRGVAIMYSHNVVRDRLFRILQVLVGREPQFRVQIPGIEAHRPDLVFFDWEHGRDLYADVVGLSPLALS